MGLHHLWLKEACKTPGRGRDSTTGAPPAQADPASKDVASRLTQLKQLHEQGLLTAEEFAQKKSEILKQV